MASTQLDLTASQQSSQGQGEASCATPPPPRVAVAPARAPAAPARIPPASGVGVSLGMGMGAGAGVPLSRSSSNADKAVAAGAVAKMSSLARMPSISSSYALPRVTGSFSLSMSQKCASGAMGAGVGLGASQASQGDFCTPQDQMVVQRSDEDLKEALEVARMPHKKAKLLYGPVDAAMAAADGSSACKGKGAHGYPAVLAPNANFFLPLLPSDLAPLPAAAAGAAGSSSSSSSSSVVGAAAGKPRNTKRPPPPSFGGGAGESAGLAAGTSRFDCEFEVVRQVGCGSYGRVFLCQHRVDGCYYAVKRLKCPVTGERKKAMLLREVFALSVLMKGKTLPQFAHRIVRYFNAWIEDEELYIQLEWCRGGTLQEDFAKRCPQPGEAAAAGKAKGPAGPEGAAEAGRPYAPQELLELLLQLSEGLAYMHAHGLAHLDVKPENVLVAELGQYRLSDLGLAAGLAEAPQAEGDRRYLPCEALDEQVAHLDKIDMFSLGATLYELATGRPLPRSDIDWAQLRNGNLADLSRVGPFLRDAIRALMHSDPLRRPSAQNVVDAVAEHLQGEGLCLSASPYPYSASAVPQRIQALEAELDRLRQAQLFHNAAAADQM
jgi:serine/threonine protein kinase